MADKTQQRPYQICHFHQKTKSLKLQLKEGIWQRLTILRCSLVVEEPPWDFLAYVRCLSLVLNPILGILSILQSDKI